MMEGEEWKWTLGWRGAQEGWSQMGRPRPAVSGQDSNGTRRGSCSLPVLRDMGGSSIRFGEQIEAAFEAMVTSRRDSSVERRLLETTGHRGDSRWDLRVNSNNLKTCFAKTLYSKGPPVVRVTATTAGLRVCKEEESTEKKRKTGSVVPIFFF